ncbi:MAG TPA: hypothetical protein VFZ40_18795 [Pyrinomonadaceae bacterium]
MKKPADKMNEVELDLEIAELRASATFCFGSRSMLGFMRSRQ